MYRVGRADIIGKNQSSLVLRQDSGAGEMAQELMDTGCSCIGPSFGSQHPQ